MANQVCDYDEAALMLAEAIRDFAPSGEKLATILGMVLDAPVTYDESEDAYTIAWNTKRRLRGSQ